MTIVSPDNYLYSNGKYIWSVERVKFAWDKSYQQLQDLLKTEQFERVVLLVGVPGAGKSTFLSRLKDDPKTIYFDATFTSRRLRSRPLQIAKQYSVPVEAIVIDVPFKVAKERNSTRDNDRRVPEQILQNMYNKLKQEPPTKDEGFKEIHTVNSQLNEEDFQDYLFRTHEPKKKFLIGQGDKGKAAKPFTIDPSYKRNKSAPPGGALEEENKMFDTNPDPIVSDEDAAAYAGLDQMSFDELVEERYRLQIRLSEVDKLIENQTDQSETDRYMTGDAPINESKIDFKKYRKPSLSDR
jgi:predicted kinase